jgi:hypothetical protein
VLKVVALANSLVPTLHKLVVVLLVLNKSPICTESQVNSLLEAHTLSLKIPSMRLLCNKLKLLLLLLVVVVDLVLVDQFKVLVCLQIWALFQVSVNKACLAILKVLDKARWLVVVLLKVLVQVNILVASLLKVVAVCLLRWVHPKVLKVSLLLVFFNNSFLKFLPNSKSNCLARLFSPRSRYCNQS